MLRFRSKYAVVLALIMSSMLLAAASVEAVTLHYDFKSVLGTTDPYGIGSFEFDSSVIAAPLPKTVVKANLTAFSYTDPLAGSFGLAELGSFNFTLGITPTTSSFAFITQSTDGLRSFTGGVVNGDNVGGLSSSVNFLVPPIITNPTLRFPVAAAVAAVPEPATLLLLVSGAAALAATHRRRRQRD